MGWELLRITHLAVAGEGRIDSRRRVEREVDSTCDGLEIVGGIGGALLGLLQDRYRPLQAPFFHRQRDLHGLRLGVVKIKDHIRNQAVVLHFREDRAWDLNLCHDGYLLTSHEKGMPQHPGRHDAPVHLGSVM